MDLYFHRDAAFRDQLFTKYLYHRLSPDMVEAVESHYLECKECFEEMRATELLIRGLAEPVLERKRVNDVTVFRFNESSQLLAASLELTELTKAIRLENDTKVLIDLSNVSRIDSTGLGGADELLLPRRQERGRVEVAAPRCRGETGAERDQD
jgi:hypothetical protein